MKNSLQKQFGENFRRLRKRKKLSQEIVAERSGTSAPYISEVESGNANPTLHTMEKLAVGLGVEVAELFLFGQVPASPEQIKKRIKSIVDNTDDEAIQILCNAIHTAFEPEV